MKKQQSLNLGQKTPFFGIFTQKCLILVFLGKNLKKTRFIFQKSIIKFVYLENFTKKQNCLNLEQKSLIHLFLGSKLKLILSYLQSVPSNTANWKISWKNKNAFILEQKCSISLFLAKKMPSLGIFGQCFEENYFCIWNQHPQISLIAKFCKTTKMPKFGTKNVLLGCFWASVLKKYSHVWSQHPQICLIAENLMKKKTLNFR